MSKSHRNTSQSKRQRIVKVRNSRNTKRLARELVMANSQERAEK